MAQEFTNQAMLTYDDKAESSNVVHGVLMDEISVTKTAVKATYGRDETIAFVISIHNNNGNVMSGLKLTDNRGQYMVGQSKCVYPLTYVKGSLKYYINGVKQAAPLVEAAADKPMTIRNIAIPPHSNAILIYEAKVNQYAPLSVRASITNEVSIAYGKSKLVKASETIYTENKAQLTITKALYPSHVVENGLLTYTFLVQNFGNTAADEGNCAVLTDKFTPQLANLNVVCDDVVWRENTDYAYNSTTGKFNSIQPILVPAAKYIQDKATGIWTVKPGVTTLRIMGNV